MSPIAGTCIVIDLETTGLDPQLEGILEIAAVRLDGGVETRVFHTLTRPEMAISLESQAIHGITDEMIADAPEPAAVLDDLLAFLGDAPLVAHNAGFDVQFLERALLRAGKPPLVNAAIDTLELAREVFPGQRSYKLESVCRMAGYEAVGFHRALDDARHLARVFPTLWERYEARLASYRAQFGRIGAVAARHEQLGELIEGLQLELAEQRRVLNRYFHEHPAAKIPLEGGEQLVQVNKDLWDYELAALRPMLVQWELADRFLKLDRPRLERWLQASRLDADQKAAIATTRIHAGRTQRIVRVSGATGSPPTDMLE